MKPVKLVLSDLGGVVVRFDNKITATKLAVHSKYDADKVSYLLFHPKHSLVHPYACGKLTTEQFSERVRELLELDHRLTDAEFDAAFADVFTPNREVIDLWDRLKMRGIGLVAVSNIEALRAHQLEKMRVLEVFDHLVFSFKEGIMKPSEDLMIRALERSNRVPEESVFVDDVAENLKPAENLGIRTHLYTGPSALRKFLTENGLGDLIYAN